MLNRLKTVAAALVGRPTPLRPRFAVFIDGDGVSPKDAKRVLDHFAIKGRINILRTYGNYTGRAAEGWARLIRNRGIVARHMPSLVPGKNATDIALAIDAIEMVLTRRIDTFVFIASDSDFTPLARRLIEGGKNVFGYGKGSTPEPFRRACTEFTVIGDLRPPEDPKWRAAPLWSLSPKDAEDAVLTALKALSMNGTPVGLTQLGQRLAQHDPGFDCRVYSRRTLGDLVRDLPSIRVTEEGGRMLCMPHKSIGSRPDR